MKSIGVMSGVVWVTLFSASFSPLFVQAVSNAAFQQSTESNNAGVSPPDAQYNSTVPNTNDQNSATSEYKN